VAEAQSQIEPHLASQPQFSAQPPVPFPPQPEGRRLVAPIWHTIGIVVIVLLTSYFASKQIGSPASNARGRLPLYAGTIIQDTVLLGLVWIGLWLKKFKMRDLIGGKWEAEDLLIDVATAALFWIVSLAALVALRYAMGMIRFDGKPNADALKSIGGILPHTSQELAGFLMLALMAGFFEEILFRGYLQKQLSAITGNAYAGLVLAGALFGAAHGYQGTRMMVLLAIYGMMFGLLAHFRKNLRPCMMAHAWQDGLAGTAFFILTKYKLI